MLSVVGQGVLNPEDAGFRALGVTCRNMSGGILCRYIPMNGITADDILRIFDLMQGDVQLIGSAPRLTESVAHLR